jgi:hypothetical protein
MDQSIGECGVWDQDLRPLAYFQSTFIPGLDGNSRKSLTFDPMVHYSRIGSLVQKLALDAVCYHCLYVEFGFLYLSR